MKLSLCVIILLFLHVAAKKVTISNVKPRLEANTGAILDAHDSKINFDPSSNQFLWFAASYGNCKEPDGPTGCAGLGVGKCGFQTDHNVTLFSSSDLATWKNEGVVFQSAGALPNNSVLFAPKTVFNGKTGEWVLWFNYIVGSFDRSYYGVASAKSPKGPFRLKVSQVQTLRYADNGDQNVFVDRDGTGYLIYTTLSLGHRMTIERLTPDFYGTEGASGSSGVIGDANVEAPSMFRRGDLYYAVFGSCCCYCEAGTEVFAYTAKTPLGPYARSAIGFGNLKSQATDIFPYRDSSGQEQFMYVGDHWQSALDRLKGHDFTVWAPLHFSADGLSVTTDGWQEMLTVDVASDNFHGTDSTIGTAPGEDLYI